MLHKNDLGGVITTPLIIFFSTHQVKDARLEKNAKNRSIREKNALASSYSPLQDCADRFIKYNYICRSLHALPTTPRRHGGALVGLAPRNKAPSTPKLKHYKSEEFLSIFRMSSSPRKRKSPPHNSKAPLLRTFWGWFCCRHVTTTSTFCQNYFVLIGKLTASHKQYRAVSFVASKVHKRTPMYN